MSKYIDAERLKAEIERLRDEYTDIAIDSHYGTVNANHVVADLEQLLSVITSLQQEQPDVNFEKAYKSYIKSRKDDLPGNAVTVNMKDLARHFWNKGYNASKED